MGEGLGERETVMTFMIGGAWKSHGRLLAVQVEKAVPIALASSAWSSAGLTAGRLATSGYQRRTLMMCAILVVGASST